MLTEDKLVLAIILKYRTRANVSLLEYFNTPVLTRSVTQKP